MSYYDERRKACSLVDEMFKSGSTDELIIFKVETVFGFGEKFVLKRLERINAFLKSSEEKED